MSKTLGYGRALILVYAVFAVSASARASYQILTKFEEAPFAYSLSAVAALVYVVATVALASSGFVWRKVALLTVSFELIGVVAVGLLSIWLPAQFNHPSVWSGFGIGYGFIPLLLPVLGLIWLRRDRATNS